MKETKNLKASVERVAALFTLNENKQNQTQKPLTSQKYMRLNFLLLSVFLKRIKTSSHKKSHHTFSLFPLFTSKIASSQNKHLLAITKQAHSCCSKQDLPLFPFKQFFLRNEFAMRRVIEWKLSKYIKSKKRLAAFIKQMKEIPPDIFRHHLVTLFDKEKPETITEEDIIQEAKKLEEKWSLWKHHADGDPFHISRT